MQEMQISSLDPEDPLEKGMATHSSILAWRIPWTEEPGGLQFMELQSRTQLAIKQQIGGGGWGRGMGNLKTQWHILLSSCQYALVDCFY